MRRASFTVALLAVGIVVAACSGSDTTPTTTTLPPSPAPSTTATPRSAATTAPGRLATIDESGNVVVIAADGSESRVVTDDGPLAATYFQPTWGPDADRLAFTRFTAAGAEVAIHHLTDESTTTSEVATPPFYYSWSDSGDRLAYLANAPEGGTIRLDVVDASGTAVRSATGQPYYFSWSGDAMVTHVGDRLDVIGDDGAPLSWRLGEPGVFRAPQWTDAGILYLERGIDASTLFLADGASEPTAVAELDGSASFLADPTGRRIAVLSNTGEATGELASAGLAQMALPANRLVVVSVESGEWRTTVTDLVLGFFWSPTGDRLLILTAHDLSAGALAWRVWSDDGVTDPLIFTADADFVRSVLPFFDQYAQSMTLWSPDGNAFAFTGAIGGDSGIWVASATAIDDVTKVADGSWVAWSPK